MNVPKSLQNPDFRFFLVGSNSKIPLEKAWNSQNYYPFFHQKILQHKGNYGVCTGPGNLIVIDFDDLDLYNSVVEKLPPTFTVLSAGRRLPHMYYILKGKMFKKNAYKDEDGNVLADIQADRCGIVGPGSQIDNRFYNVSNSRSIAEITIEELQGVFKIQSQYRKEYTGPTGGCPKKVSLAIKVMELVNIKRTHLTLFECPFHAMSGKGNLTILDTGRIYCFHEQKTWQSVFDFAEDVCKLRDGKLKVDVIKIMRLEYE